MRHVSRPLPSSQLTTNTSPGCYSVQTSSKIRARLSRASLACGADPYLKVPGHLFCRHDGENLVSVPEFRVQVG